MLVPSYEGFRDTVHFDEITVVARQPPSHEAVGARMAAKRAFSKVTQKAINNFLDTSDTRLSKNHG